MRLFLVFLLAMLACPVHAASFDCARATTPNEKRVCADPVSSKLDEEMSAAYQQALARTAGAAAIRRWQRQWLKSDAWTGCADAACVRKALTERIALLESVGPLDSEAGAFTGYFVRHAGLHVDKHYADLLLVGLADGRVLVEGSAIWLGPNADNGQVNTGEIAGNARAGGKALAFADGQCTVAIDLKADGLSAKDNGQCGGHNVSFTGAYRKMQKSAP